jgi:uncharacterized protein (TIGR02466 family)
MPPDSPHPLQLRPLFPLALGQVQLAPDPLDTALLLRDILELRGEATGNPAEGCAWTGDLHRVWQLHRRPAFAPLLRTLVGHAGTYLERVGFARERVALHLQRSWPVVSAFGQGIGRHHHPNAHLSGVYYLNGDGSGRSGCLRFFPPAQANELVPGLAVGYDGPIRADGQEAQLWNAPWVDVAPRAGLLLLFPAQVDHAVLENQDPDDNRVSISFDLALTAPAAAGGDGEGGRSVELEGAAELKGAAELEGAAPPEYLAPHPSDWDPLA